MSGDRIKDLVGCRFEKLVVLEFYDKYIKGNYRRNAISKMVESGDNYSSNHGQISNTKADNPLDFL